MTPDPAAATGPGGDPAARLARCLDGLAASGERPTYGALARALGLRMADLTAALEQTMEDDSAAGRPLRAALIEARLTPGLPAPGFFAKARALGHSIGTGPGSEAAFVAAQRRALARG